MDKEIEGYAQRGEFFDEDGNLRIDFIKSLFRTKIEDARREERERISKAIDALKISAERPDLESIANIYRTFWAEIKTKLHAAIAHD